MKKKIVTLFALFFVFAALALGIPACTNDNPSAHEHAYDRQVASANYLAKDATCTEKAVYYYSCPCGEKGTATFTYGEALGHSFTNYVSDNNATCTQDGTKTAKCDRCDETNTVTDVGSALGHNFVNYVCTRCGEEQVGIATGLEYTLSNDGTYYIVSRIGSETLTEFRIPSTYNDKPVKGIGEYAFV